MKAFVSWSGGKDSALSLYNVQQASVPVAALLTSVSAALNRVSMHGVRRGLLEQQAQSLRLPLHTVELPEMPGPEAYEATLQAAHRQLRGDGFTTGIFGDIFLEDLKQYREKLLANEGLQGLFPLWKMDPRAVVADFLRAGFKAVVVCVNRSVLNESFCGRLMDASFFNDLPDSVDPCGENGEYHSFVFDGPNFAWPVPFEIGETVYREYAAPKSSDDPSPMPPSGFHFCDLLPLKSEP